MFVTTVNSREKKVDGKRKNTLHAYQFFELYHKRPLWGIPGTQVDNIRALKIGISIQNVIFFALKHSNHFSFLATTKKDSMNLFNFVDSLLVVFYQMVLCRAISWHVVNTIWFYFPLNIFTVLLFFMVPPSKRYRIGELMLCVYAYRLFSPNVIVVVCVNRAKMFKGRQFTIHQTTLKHTNINTTTCVNRQ